MDTRTAACRYPSPWIAAGMLVAVASACVGGPPAGLVFSDPAPARSFGPARGPWHTLRVRIPLIADDKTRTLGTTQIRVQRSDDGSAGVEVFLFSPNMAWAQRVFDTTGMRVQRDDGLLLVEAARANTNVSTGLSVGLQPAGGRPPGRDSAIRRLTIVVEATVPEDIDVDIEIGAGAVEVGQLVGEALISATEGDIRIGSIVGNLQVRTGKGDVSIGEADVMLGRLDTTDGDIEVVLLRAHTVRFVAARGDIEVHVPARMGANLDLRGREVVLDDALLVQGAVAPSSVLGRLNEGGGVLEASSPTGRIRVVALR